MATDNSSQYAHMSTWEYAHELQSKMFGDHLKDVDAGWCDVLAASILGSLPPDHRRLLDDVPIVVLPTKNPNAMIILAPNGGHVIAIDYGLISFLSTLNKIILCRLSLFGLEPTLTHQDAFKISKDTVNHFLGDGTSLHRWPIAPKKMLIASALGNIQMSFIIGHEIGHMILGHLKKGQNDIVKWMSGGDEEADPFYETHAYKAFRFKDMPSQEFDADIRAAELVLTHFRKTYDPLFGDSEKAYAQAGIDILFSYFDYMRNVAGLPDDSPTHPPSIKRKEMIRDYLWHDIPEASRKIATAFETIVNSFQDMLKEEKDKI